MPTKPSSLDSSSQASITQRIGQQGSRQTSSSSGQPVIPSRSATGHDLQPEDRAPVPQSGPPTDSGLSAEEVSSSSSSSSPSPSSSPGDTEWFHDEYKQLFRASKKLKDEVQSNREELGRMRGNMRPHGGSRRDAVFEAGHSAANTALHEIDMYIDMIMKRLPLVLEGYRSMEKQGFDGAPERAAELEQKLDTATKRMQNFSLKDKKN